MRFQKVLIIGNGISRLTKKVKDFIDSFDGEKWICNQAWKDFPEARRLTGHTWCMDEAYQAGFKGEIWGGNLGRANAPRKDFTCPARFQKDSGSTLVAQALHEGYEKVYLAGFDFGGADVYSPDHWTIPKPQWLTRHIDIYDHYRAWPCIEFVGYDHKTYLWDIKHGESPKKYSSRYIAGVPHIPGKEYMDLLEYMEIPIYPSLELVPVKYKAHGLVGEMKYRIALKMEKEGIVQVLAHPE